MIYAGLILTLWLIAVPFASGLFFTYFFPKYRRDAAVIYVSGLLIQFAVFFFIALYCLLMIEWYPFGYVRAAFCIIMGVISVMGLGVSRRLNKSKGSQADTTEIILNKSEDSQTDTTKRFLNKSKDSQTDATEYFLNKNENSQLDTEGIKESCLISNVKTIVARLKKDRELYSFWVMFFCFLGYNLYMKATTAFFDGDDAYYVTESVITQSTDTMYTILPYTGLTTTIDWRHALALIPMWIAFIAQMSGLHAAVIAHTVLPVFFILLTYLIFYLIGREFFSEKKELIPIFLFILCLFQMFGNVSIYTAETFLMTRTSQGKALMAGIVIPLIIWIFSSFFKEAGAKSENKFSLSRHEAKSESSVSAPDITKANEEKSAKHALWINLTLINIFAGMCTSIGVLLAAALVMLLALILAVYSKSIKQLIYAFLTCVPNVLYMLLYVVLIT